MTKGKPYQIKPTAIRRALERLTSRRSHNHLPAYFALLRLRGANDGRGTPLKDIERFHKDYLRVGGAPPGKPYIQPFRSRGEGAVLFNRNVQGSYAPSSIRADSPLSSVIRITQEQGRAVAYRLVDDHADIVLSRMLAGNKLLSVSLAVFLFRDRELTLESAEISQLNEALREFFFIRPIDPFGDQVYGTLFEDDAAAYSHSDLESV